MVIFKYLTPAVYGMLVVVWGYILYFYLRRLSHRRADEKLLTTLLVVLAIAALSTFFESIFFGVRYGAVTGFFPAHFNDFLERPEIVIVPKGFNLLAGSLIIVIILRRWLPQEETERRARRERQETLEGLVVERTHDLERSNEKLSADLVELNLLASALRQSDARFRAVFEHGGLGIVVVDLDTKVLDCNKAFAHMVGYSIDEVIARGIEGITHPDDVATSIQLAQDVAKGIRKSYQFDKRYIHKDGSILWGSLTGTAVWDDEGNPVFGIGMVKDITERRNAEAATRESEAVLRAFFDSAPFRMGIVELESSSTRYVSVNTSFADFAGTTVENVTGRTSSELGFDRETTERWFQYCQRSISENRPIQFEDRHLIRGRTEIVDACVAPIEVPPGSPPRLLFVVEDITDRKDAEEELTRQRLLMDTIMQQAADAVVVCDQEGRYVFMNKAARRIAHISEDTPLINIEPLNLWGTAYDREGREIYHEDWSIPKALRGETYQSVEARMVRSDGTHYDILISSAPVKDRNGDIVAAVATFSDITERNTAETERRRLETQMQHAQKLESLGVLAGGIAHDFNNLLVGILGNADLALSEIPQHSAAATYLHDVMTAAQRASDLSRQMLAYSGRGRFVVEPINLNDIIREMAHLLEVSISKSVVLRFHLTEPLRSVEADATQIRQVVMNLITNASDAIGDAVGTISVTTAAVHCTPDDFADSYPSGRMEEGDFVVLEVTDTGRGMDPDTVARAFEPFFTTKFAGRGLGLAVVLGIVRGHRGIIQVKSTPGESTVFSVFFPASTAPPVQLADASEPLPLNEQAGTVLLVDDEQSVRNVMSRMLERMGFTVVTANNGVEGIDRFRDHAKDVTCVFLDLTMPQMDGEATFKALREIREDVPIVLTSGYSDQELETRFSGYGFAGFLQKPFRKEDLYKMVGAVLG